MEAVCLTGRVVFRSGLDFNEKVTKDMVRVRRLALIHIFKANTFCKLKNDPEVNDCIYQPPNKL